MRIFGKWLGRIMLALAVAAAAVGLWKREEIMRLLAVNSLFSADKIVNNFSNMNAAFLTVPVPRGDGPTSPLPYGPETTLPETADDWIRERNITALVVLKNGEIVFEEYFKGTSAEDRRIGWSVAKSYLSALVGILIDEGRIADWVIASTTPSAPPAAPTAPATGKFYDYGYQWWIPKDASPREYLARGIYGQYIYINEPENVVIVTNSADRQFREPGIDPSNVEMFRLITGNL